MTGAIALYATRRAGAVSCILLSSVVTLGILSARRWRTAARPRFPTVGLHRNLARLSVVFLALRIVTAVVDPYTSLGWFAALVPFSSNYRTFWLALSIVAADLFAALVLTSLLRQTIGPRTWRLVHWIAYGCWPAAPPEHLREHATQAVAACPVMALRLERVAAALQSSRRT